MAREPNSAVNLVTKFVLFTVNFFIFILAAAVVGLMAWVIDGKDKEIKNAYDFFLDPAIMLCLVGCISFAVAGFGWVGAFRENITLLKIYGGVMTALFFLQIVFVVLIFVVVYVPDARDTLGIYPEDSLKNAIVKYRDDPDLQDLIDSIQTTFDCCGTSNDEEGYKDWSKNEYFACDTATNKTKKFEFCAVPFSCCIESDDGLINYMCGRNMQDPDTDPIERARTIYSVGCLKAITDLLNNNVLVVGGVLIGIFIPQMLLSYLSRSLSGQIKTQMAKWNRQPRGQ